MTSKLYFQDDSIQLVEIHSDRSSTDNLIQSPSSLNKLKKKNKIDSPTILSENVSTTTSTNSKISDVFIVKKPIPAPRRLKALNSKENSEIDLQENVRKSSDTLDTISGDVQSIFSQKSDNLSYKERLRSRFLTIKKQAENTINNKEKINVNKQKKDRETAEAILQKEESVLSEELTKYNKQKADWSHQQQNEFDFFCKMYENDEKEISDEKNAEKPSEVDESTENGKKLVSEFLGIDHLDTDVVENIFSHFVDYSLNEKDVFLMKKYRIRANDETKCERRNYEEEGIYKSNLNHISKYQLTQLEDHLYFDNNSDWFNSDGELKIIPDPRFDHPVKPVESTVTHETFIHKYIPPTLYEPAEHYINIHENTLEILIDNIEFKHHSLFSREHILQQILIDLYKKYNQFTSDNVLYVSSKKLEALRSAKRLLENTIQESNNCNETQLERYEKYLIDIKNIREVIYAEGIKERILKKQILFVWKSIKNLRKTQNYSSTAIKLQITKEITDYKNEKQVWEQHCVQESNEILEELENKYEAELNEYKIKLKQWKGQKSNEENSECSEQMKEKPKKPKKSFNQDDVKEHVLERMNQCLKPPGEPNLDFNLIYENDISQTVDTVKETLRRNEVSKTKIFVKILYNNYEVCKSKCVHLNDNFICHFNEQFTIKLYKIPNHLTLQIFEQSTTINKRLISEVIVPIPAFESTISEAENQSFHFENNDVLKHHHLGQGTDIHLNQICEINDDSILFTNGSIHFKLGWILDKNYENIFEHAKQDSFHLIPTVFDMESLESWIKKYPDPLDPNNAPFYEYINAVKQDTSTMNYFRLNPDMETLEFCTDDDLDSNPRFKILKLRFNKEPEFKNIVVPNRIKEISDDVFTAYEKRKKEEIITPEILTEQSSIDMHRKYTRKYLLQAENRIIQLGKVADRKINLKDVINEEFIPSFGSLTSSFLNWLQPKRPLRPKRKSNKNISSQITFKHLNILVNIIGAIQVPYRKEYAQFESSNSSLKSNYSHISVRPFATASFRDECARTTVAEGSNPVWNQELSLTIRNNENFSMQSLQTINDSIVINLYDETVDDLIEDDRIRDTNIHQHLGCNWLGNFEIPFKTLLINNRIEGTFKINLPTVLLGYERQNIKTFHESGDTFSQKIDTFLTIFITLQPSVPSIQNDIQSDLQCIESEFFIEFINNWQLEFNNLFPNRKFSTFITTLNGEKCCITRLFKEIKFPDLNLEQNEEIATMKLLKYVSLIPFRENSNSAIIPDIWLQAEQLLSLMMGSIKDHCVLLTCYFLSLGLKTWLLLGFSLLETYTAFVLTKEKTEFNYEFFVYDVKAGKKYYVYDSNCPLQKVFCIMNDENVWANIQEDDRIHQTKFDISKSSDWLALFNKDISAPANLQQTNVTYLEAASVVLLQEKIERKLRKKLMKWRKFSRTTFNHYCNASLKKILVKLEYDTRQNPESPEHYSEIQNLMSSYQIRGFAKSFPYTNANDLIDFVERSGVHLNDNPNIEFSLSVYAHSYSNNAVIVWLFIATLIRKR